MSNKRGEHNKTSPEDKAKTGKYASDMGVAKAVRHFKDQNVKDSSVRDWRRTYEKELKQKSRAGAPVGEVQVMSLPGKMRGRPPLLGGKVDKYLQEIILEMRSRGTPNGSTIVVAVCRGILLQHNKQMLPEEDCIPVKIRQNRSYEEWVILNEEPI